MTLDSKNNNHDGSLYASSRFDNDALQEKTTTANAAASFVMSASQLRGLTFGNKIDELLQGGGGIAPKTFTFIYGPGNERMMNILCGKAVQTFGGRAVFIDAANSFDPYTIVRECIVDSGSSSSEKISEEILRLITISRAFTCYQLTDLVVKQVVDLIEAKNNPRKNLTNKEEKEAAATANDKIKFLFVSGISSVFNAQDNSKAETERLQFLMSSSLQKIALDKNNGVLFVVASSKERCAHFVSKSDTSIEIYLDRNASGGEGEEERTKVRLVKHHLRQFAEINL